MISLHNTRHSSLQPADERFHPQLTVSFMLFVMSQCSCREAGKPLAEEFDTAFNAQVSDKTVRLYPGIKSLVTELHERLDPWTMGVLTNGTVDYARTVLRAHGVRELFACVHGADDVPKPKPEPEGLLQCCHEMVTACDQSNRLC